MKLGDIIQKESKEEVRIEYFDVLWKPNAKFLEQNPDVPLLEHDQEHALVNVDQDSSLTKALQVASAETEDDLTIAMKVKATEIFLGNQAREPKPENNQLVQPEKNPVYRNLQVMWAVILAEGDYSILKAKMRTEEYFTPKYVKYKAKATKPRVPGTIDMMGE